MKVYLFVYENIYQKMLLRVLHKVKDQHRSVEAIEVSEHLSDQMASESMNTYILCSNRCHQDEYLTLAKKIRDMDPRGFLIYITENSLILEQIFAEKIELIDFIVFTTEEDLKNRLHKTMGHIEQKLGMMVFNKKRIFFETKDKIESVALNEIRSVHQISRHKYRVVTNTSALIVRGSRSGHDMELLEMIVNNR